MVPRAWCEGRLQVLHESSSGAAADMKRGLTLLRAAAAGSLGPTLRLYRPQPTVAFGQRDTRLPGFEAASDAARAHGFAPLVRKAGGRAAAYHEGCLIVDHIEPHDDAVAGSHARFRLLGEILAESLRRVGVDARMGQIPGEYCPGEFSVHGVDSAHAVKLVGTAQRVISGAWLFSSVIVVEGSASIRSVLEGTYSALELPWEPSTAGAAEDLVPGLTVDAVASAVVAAYEAVAAPAL